MGYLAEKAAYLRGFADGLNIDEKGDEGKVIAKLIDLAEELAASVDDVTEAVEECEDRIDDLEGFAGELSECFSDCEHEGCDCCGDSDEDDFEDEELDDVEFYEVKCPHCNEKVYFDEDMVDSGDLVCPNCNQVIEIEIDA